MQKTKLLLNILAFFLCALPAIAVAQGGGNVTVRGIVTSADDKQPLIGVNVISGATSGVSTLADGSYSISVAAGSTLTFQYIGYKPATFTVPGGSASLTYNVSLESEAQALDDVVVIAYGVRKKGTIAGSVSTVKAEKVENTPTAAFDQAIQGQVPGLTVLSNSGEPSTSATMMIRGMNSINSGTSPLYILDGVAIASSDFNTINPADIESISVLKDASSTAVYGARGAFGVVLVTTKKARQDKISVDYSGSVSIISETVRPKYETDSQTWYDNYMTAYVGYSHHLPTGINNFFPWTQSWEDEYKKRMNDPDQSYLDWGLDASGKYQYYGRNTDWYDMFYKKSTTAHQHNIRISGGGKTTLCNLIPRFYEVTDGRILIDGQDIRHVTLKSLRQDIGIVQQDVYLFSGTVAQNIAYGKPGATREEIVEAARLAGAERFILALKDGFDTYVGERGVKLSGGQKQRIAIARVFLKNPSILILDEATSALDNESEILVGQSLEKLAHGRTTLTIAHRLTTIKDYDRILVLGEEGIVESGTHEQLLAKQGVYYRLWNQLPGEDTL